MKKHPLGQITKAVLICSALLTFCSNARALNYIYVSNGVTTWQDVGNWYFSNPDDPDGQDPLIPAGSLPGNADSIEVSADSAIDLTGIGNQSTIIMDQGSEIVGGSCTVNQFSATDATITNGASITVTYQAIIDTDITGGGAYFGLKLLGNFDAGESVPGGTFTLGSSAIMIVYSAGITIDSASTFINEGSLTLLSGTNIYGLESTSTSTPNPNGMFQNYGFLYPSDMTGMGVSDAGPDDFATIPVTFQNRGTISLASGTFTLVATFVAAPVGNTNPDTLETTSAGALIFLSDCTVPSTETITVKGPGTTSFGGTLDGTINCGIIDPTSGNLDPGNLELYSASGTGTLNILGQSGTGSILSSNGGSGFGAGEINIQAGAGWTVVGQVVDGVQEIAGVELTGSTVNNAGTITVNNGNFENADGEDDIGSTVINNLPGGLIDMQTNANIDGGVINNSGTVTKSQAASVSDGSLIGASFTNNGTVQVLTSQVVAVDFVQSATGTLSLAINSASNYGSVSATTTSNSILNSSATLNGALVLTLQNNYTPTPGAVFPVVDSSNTSGNFSTVTTGFTTQLTGNALTATYAGGVSDPFGGSSLGGGWFYSSWFGYYNSTYYPWDYRTDLGFIYVDTNDNTNLYLYVVNGNPAPMGWLYTSQSVFPNVYSFTKGSWLYFDVGTTSFYNYTTRAWETY